MALRTPISRVRSVTDTSMMFITPTPPTIRAMEEIASITGTRVGTVKSRLHYAKKALKKLIEENAS